MNEENETSIDRMFSEEIEAIIALLEDPEILDYFTLFSPKELEWTKEVWKALSATVKPEAEYESYRLSPKKRKEIQKAKNYHKNMKSKVKMKVIKECIDLARVAWIHREYADEALEDMYPLSAIEHVVRTLVFRFGYEYAIVIASAIENGLLMCQAEALPEYPKVFEISVPVNIRVKSETAGKLGMELWKKAFERYAERQSTKKESP